MRKTTIILSVLALIVSSCVQTGNKQATNNASVDTLTNSAEKLQKLDTQMFTTEQSQAIEMIREFYTLLITENAKISDFDFKTVEAIENKYISKKLIQEFEKEGLDSSTPFVQALDWEEAWLETLKIDPITGQDNAYKVCYQYLPDLTKCFILFLVNNNGQYQINDLKSLGFD